MARGDKDIDPEKKSRSVLFLLSAATLLVTGVWAIWNDNISRRPWKLFQYEFRRVEYERAEQALEQEDARLAADPKVQELHAQLAAAQKSLGEGELHAKIRTREADIAKLQKQLAVVDLDLRFVKSELEEAWYHFEHARELGEPTEARWAHVQKLEQHRGKTQVAFDDLNGQIRQLESELKELHAGVTVIESQLAETTTERSRLEQKRDGLLVHVAGPIRILQVPRIEQTVLLEFDRNAYNQPVERVDRCVSCHTGINKAGFDDLPHPHRTHPDREKILGKHPPEKFGCTPCHEGQGVGVNSPAQAHGLVMFWERPLLRDEKVQSRCGKCHLNVAGLAHAASIATGQELFEQLGCHGCHLVEGVGDLPKAGPYLRRIAAKVDPSWLARWVTNPHEFRPDTRMPNFLFKPDQGTAVAAYLLKASARESTEWLAEHPAPTGIDPSNTAQVERGRQLTQEVGCRGCHAFAPGEHGPMLGHQDKDIAPNLANVAEKTSGRWLYHWVRNPKHYSPVARMPSLRLTDDEARAITAYLLTLGSPKAEPEERLTALQQEENLRAGEKLVRKYGCAGCHDIPGMENESRIGVELSTFGAKTIDELFFGTREDIPRTWDAWTFNKIKTPRTYETERIEQLMPQFDLKDEDIQALRLFLYSRNEHVVPASFRYKPNDPTQQRLQTGRRLVQHYNCTGCHVIADTGGFIRSFYEDRPSFAPPVLNGEGAKVQPAWLFGFLKSPTTIRPWLNVRMPTFGLSDEETNAIVEYFRAQSGSEIPFVFVNAAAVPDENIEAARLMMSPDYFNCYSCHVRGDKKPEGPPEGWAPDLAMAKHRLNPNWIVEWLRDPQKVQPGTKMPSFYPGGPEDVFGGDEERQIHAIRDYLMVLGTARDAGNVQVAHGSGSASAR